MLSNASTKTYLDIGFPLSYDFAKMTFSYGSGCFGPEPERRRLDSIRPSLRDPDCEGPEIVYVIGMDVGNEINRDDLILRNLLYGVVMYPAGRLGLEPIRSQGHIHAVSASCGSSTAELYEIHVGTAIVYMQEKAEDNPGRCFAVTARSGELVIVPPGWAHMTVNADVYQPMAFGAWCVRDYGFDYTGVRAHRGLAYFPLLESEESNRVIWQANLSYRSSRLIEKTPASYREWGIEAGISIYRQYQKNCSRFDFIPQPAKAEKLWKNFIP